jgi:hypothetical protein
MAVVRTAGTEIIRSIFNEEIANTERKLIFGVQHHIYTVLSVICYCTARSGTEKGYLKMVGYDSNAGTSAQIIYLAQLNNDSQETFVFNDKFSFNGHEPTDFTGPMDSIVKQDAIADQGSSVAQYLSFETDGSGTQYDLTVTYIDQNNA